MNTLLKAPARWSEQVVGSWPRFMVSLVAQVGGVLFACWLEEWRHVGPLLLFGLMLPLSYLIALRGVIQELHCKAGEHDEG